MAQTGQQTPQPKSWELSLYELHRTPQEAITDDTEISISPRSLHSELMCPICLDMLKCTMTTKECLHRFCQDCIITALRSGNKECPTCRKKLISKRSLRPDPNFDALIEKIYPSRDEYDAHQEKVLQKLNRHHNQQALTSSIEEGLRIQAQNRLQRMMRQQRKAAEEQQKLELQSVGSLVEKVSDDIPQCSSTPKVLHNKKRPKPQADGEDDSNHPIANNLVVEGEDISMDAPSAYSDSHSRDTPSTDEMEVEVVLRVHPEFSHTLVGNQQPRYIKTTTNASVDHLSRYLCLRMDLEKVKEDCESSSVDDLPTAKRPKDFSLFAQASATEHQLLEGTVSLNEVNEQFGTFNKPLDLYYAPKEDQVNKEITSYES